MIGLRRAAPDRQGNPYRRAPPSQLAPGDFNVQIQKLLRPSLSAADPQKQAFTALFCTELLPRAMMRRA